jgi:hypothetical protein
MAQGSHIRPTYRSVEQTKYKDNHNGILAMVTHKTSGAERIHATSLEPSKTDLYSHNWERRHSTMCPADESICTPTTKKKKLRVKRKPTVELTNPAKDEEGIFLLPPSSIGNNSPKTRNLNQGITPFKHKSGREDNLNDSIESPTRRPLKKMRLKKKVSTMVEN